MNDRTQRALDGELPAGQLSGEERAQLRVLENVVSAVVGRIRAPAAPDLVEETMRRVAEARHVSPEPAGRNRWRRAIAWLWSPRAMSLTMRPAWALAALALLVALPFALRETTRPAPPESTQRGIPAATPLFVQFRLEAPGASRVELAGSFTDWQPSYELYQTAPGVWTALVPLTAGVHDYTFVVDGRSWIPDPHAPQVPDSFGGTNSRLTLLPPHEAV